MCGRRALVAGGVLAALMAAGPSWAPGAERVPLSRVLMTETDLRASIAKVSLSRYYLERALGDSAEGDGARLEAAERAARSVRAAAFYLGSSLAFSRGELKDDLEALRGELASLEEWIGRDPSEALETLRELEGRIREVLGAIDRDGRTYKGSPAWVPAWGTDGARSSP